MMKKMKIMRLAPSSMAGFCLFFALGANAGPPNKIDICHVPMGSPDNTQLIRVGANGNALNAHLSHGDWEATDPICEDDIDDNDCDGVIDDPNSEHYDCVLQTGNPNAFCDNAVCVVFDAELVIDSPAGIAGVYPGSKGVNPVNQIPFDIQGLQIEPANPLNADTPLVNDLSGKIALIASDGFNTPSSNKADNAAAAGAVAAIIYNSDSESLIPIFGGNFIPTISVGKSVGESILANPPVFGGIRSVP